MNFLKFLSTRYRKPLFSALIVLLVLIIFEACQQYFYIRQYNLVPAEEIQFSLLLFGQLYRWSIWFMITICYFGLIIYHGKIEKILNPNRLIIYAGQIVALIILNLLVITFIQVSIYEDSLNPFGEYLTFYFFQKTPIYLLSYIAVMALLQMAYKNQHLELEVIGLEKLADEQKSRYKALHQSIQSPDSQALSVKVGKKNKLIPLSDINWIEADDYCVKIHTDHDRTYAMRNSLKTLSSQLLANHFLRVHRQALVNMEKVREVKLADQPFIILENNTEIAVAKSRVKEIREYLKMRNLVRV